MLLYIARRILETIPTLLGVLVLIFFFVRALPGDPARLYSGVEASAEEVEQVRERLGLNAPLPVQFYRFVVRLVKFDLGISYRADQPVSRLIARFFIPTFYLSLLSIGIASLFGILFGLIAAVRRNTLEDLGIASFSILGISTPSFFLGILLIYLFAVRWQLLPVSGGMTFKGFVLPALTLAASSLGTIARFSRSSLLEVLGLDFIRTAKAKGLGFAFIIHKHALRNALIPVMTIIGLQFGFLLSGAIIVETVFNFPGLGRLLIQSIDARDYPVIQALMLLFSVQFVIINLLVDLLYGVVDPRISYE